MNRNSPKFKLFLLSLLSGFLLSATFLLLAPQKTHAIDTNTILQKALANGINYCYSNGAMKTELEDARSFSVASVVSASGAIVIPNGSTINCRQAFAGNNNSLQAVYGKTPSTPTNLGYTFTKSTQTVQRCAHITYRYQGKNKQTNDVCFEVMNNNNDYPNGSLELPVVKSNGSGPLSLLLNGDGNIELYDSAHPGAVTSTFSYGSNWNTFESNMNKVVNYIKSVQVPDSKDPNVYITPFNDPNYKSEESSSDSYQKYTLGDTGAAALVALKFYTGKSSFDEVKFTNADMKFMWRQAIQSMIKDKAIYLQENDCHAGKEDAKKAAGTGYIFYNTDTNLWCPVDISNNNKTYPIVESSMTRLMLATPEQILQAMETENAGYETDKDACNQKALSSRRAAESWINQSTTPDDKRKKARNLIKELDEILKKTNTLGKPEEEQIYWYEENGAIICYSYTELNDQPGGGPPTGDNTDPGGGDDDDGSSGGNFDSDECYDAAGSLGWILCPVLKVVTEATDSIYNDYIQKDFLEVKTTWMDQVYSSWDSIRKIANLLFVIFFVIIVFSQLTGIGLTNYAIKKALPRLVMVVVLVNVSFLICQLAVDLSNILGYTLNAMFDGLAGSGNGGMGSIGNSIMSGLTWAGIALVAYKTAAFWLIPFLLAALSAIISVIFGALILGIRQAGVLVLVALAPAAIACYALPNTKSLFDKWSKAFLSLLMVFPICGALVGGGNFAASLILNASDNVMLSVIAMLLRVAPFFFIPSIVKSSLTALGNIGMRVSNFGSRLSRSATGAIAKSDAAKYADANLRAQRAGQIERGARLRSKLNSRLRNVPGIGGAVSAIEDSALGQKIGAASRGRRDAKVARLYSRADKLMTEEALAGANARSLKRGSAEYNAIAEAARLKRVNQLAGNIEDENIDVPEDPNTFKDFYRQAIANYQNDSSDENLAAVYAANNMAIKQGDPGRELYNDTLGWATESGLDKGVMAMARHMKRDHTGDLKPVARDTYAATVAGASGKLAKGMFEKGIYTDKKGNQEEHYVSTDNMNKSLSSYDAAGLIRMDEGAIKRLIMNSGNIDQDGRETIDRLTSEALLSPYLNPQDKVTGLLNTLRTNLGLTTINRSPNGTTEGPVLRTGNDDRSTAPRIDLDTSDENFNNARNGR